MLIAERRALFAADDTKWAGEDEVRRLTPNFKLYPSFLAEEVFLAHAKRLDLI